VSDTLAMDELELLRTTVRRVLTGRTERRTLTALGDLGLLGLLVDEDRGGAGWCPVEASVVADEVGRAAAVGAAVGPGDTAVAAPWLPAALAAAAVARVVDPSLRDRFLAGMLDGTAPGMVATGSLPRHGDPAQPTVTGTLTGVTEAAGATVLVVLDGAGDLLVELDQPGVLIGDDQTSIDTTRAVRRVELVDVVATPFATEAEHASPALLDTARVLAAAELVGSLRAANERLFTYLSERVAFDAPVASFQAVQHRLVDLFLLEVRAGVAVETAARALAGDVAAVPRACAVAHGYVAERIPAALDECVQLSGGIGFTWEYPLHHELRRAVTTGALVGSARESRARLAEIDGW
jgi:alkylation response protein AidB-like acyl-CoA dehydrogenase